MEWTSQCEAELFGHGRGALAELGGREDVAGLVDEGAGEVLALAEDDAFVEAGLQVPAVLGEADEDGEGVDAEVFAVGAVEVDVEVGDEGAFGDGAAVRGGGRGQVRACLRGRRWRLVQAAGAGEADGDAGGLADLVDGERVGFAQADEQKALGLGAGGGVEQEGFAERGFELAGGEPGGGGVGEGVGGGEEGGVERASLAVGRRCRRRRRRGAGWRSRRGTDGAGGWSQCLW